MTTPEQIIELTKITNELHLDAPLVFISDDTIEDKVNYFIEQNNLINNTDYRLYNERTPLPHYHNHAITGSDPLSPSDIGAQPAGIYVTPPVHMTELSNDINESFNVIKRLAKAWINFNGTGIISIRSAFNISSIIDNGTGDYTINFLVPFSNSNYSFFTWSRDWNTDNIVFHGLSAKSNTTKTASSIRLLNNNNSNGFNYDSSECHVLFFGI